MFLLSLGFYRVICSLVQQLSVISWIERNPTQSLSFLGKTVLSVRAACSLHLALRKASPCLSDMAAFKHCSTFSHSLGQDQTQSTAA